MQMSRLSANTSKYALEISRVSFTRIGSSMRSRSHIPLISRQESYTFSYRIPVLKTFSISVTVVNSITCEWRHLDLNTKDYYFENGGSHS